MTIVEGGAVIAYKFLRNGCSAFTGTFWPTPEGGRPGAWLEVTGELGLCANGLHACLPSQLPPWMSGELWAVELDGEIIHTSPAVIARRGRLLGAVSGWNAQNRSAFAADCAARAARTAADDPSLAEVAAFMKRFVDAGAAGPSGYWAAVVAGQAASGVRRGRHYDEAFAAERSIQAAWLTEQLSLQDS